MIQNALNGEFAAPPAALTRPLPIDYTAEPWFSARHDGPAPVTPITLPLASAGDVAITDWDALLSAVRSRLRQSVGSLPPAELNGAAAPLRTSVLECVDALDQLHGTLTHALARLPAIDWRESDLHHDTPPARATMRHWLDGVLATRHARSAPCALLYVGLDRIEAIRDMHGAAVHDELLQAVAARLAARTALGPDGLCVAGGNAFVCAPDEAHDRERLGALARDLFDVIAAPLWIGATEFRLCASVGVALWPADGASSDAVLDQLEAAMRRARRRQSGHAFCDVRATN